jgi:predicted MPP superfamily phosphohydrolase
MIGFTLASLAALAALVTFAARRGGRPFATFAGIIFGIHTLVSCVIAPRLPPWAFPLYAFGQAAFYLHAMTYARGSMPSLLRRLVVSWPGSAFAAGTFLAIPWAVVGTFSSYGTSTLWIPYGAALLGLFQSFALRPRAVHVHLDGAPVEALRRTQLSPPREAPALRLVQISDPHLGTFMSEARLRAVCERAVAAAPDLVLLTGDFLTIESNGNAEALGRALEPLRALEGRTFACFGNHDHETPDAVRRGLAHAGVTLLVDDLQRVETARGPVEVVGYDFVFRERAEHLAAVTARLPRDGATLRIAMLHDPGAFAHLPAGAADLVLAGHTHGGQVGLVSFGLPYTAVSALSDIPDHGLWALGVMKLYVHRGTGHYGFPVRVGVGPEESVLHVHDGRAAHSR